MNSMSGMFYYKMEAYNAALGRFVSLVKNYPDTGYHQQALEYIILCRQKIADSEAKDSGVAKGKKDGNLPSPPRMNLPVRRITLKLDNRLVTTR